MALPLSYYQNEDVVFLARNLLGKILVTNIGGIITRAIIAETEAYAGEVDKASHAYGGRRTNRTEVMYKSGGVTYVYLCYGMHNMLNIVTGPAGIPHAVLIRGIILEDGVGAARKRTGKNLKKGQLIEGPGNTTKTLGITREHNGLSLNGHELWLEDGGFTAHPVNILASKRIGIDYAGKDALLPYRFRLK
ncbi:MAG TPA: DNA-3-methyladenine glycosylase [Bacteroidetes bacterium]|nr:DNA-3-methyladenine glycosylase [Bacteroidota bacterium]